MANLDPRLLEILVCPACKGPVEVKGEQICCQACALAYPIRSGIPVMLVTEARPFSK